ncbi:MAG: nitrite/sulfite reductase [Rhodospirillales bacterium]|nr:nitrite/sulfite reductase [Rhodospirillales bacterium]
MALHVITGNRLADGISVWFAGPKGWAELVGQAVGYDEAGLEAALAQANPADAELHVVDIRAVEVTREGGMLFPVAHREQIRARGPSVRADLPAGVWRDGAEPLPPLPSASSSSPFAGIYRYDEYDRDFLRQRATVFGEQVERRRKGELTEDEFKPLRLMNGVYLQLHAYMLRIAIPYGVLSATQLRQLAYVARHYDRGYGHFTTRQNIQFNWLRLEDVPDALAALAEADIHGIQTSGNCIRNTTTDEFAGAAADEIVDPRLYAEIIRQWSTDHPEFTYLPRKFKIAIVGAGHDRAAVRVHDIGIEAYRDAAGAPVFRIFAGGGLGRTPYVAVQLREDLPVPELLRYCEAILRVYNALGRRDNMYKARIKILIREMKPEAFIKMVEDEYASMAAGYCLLTDEMVQAVAARFPVPEFPRQDTGVLKSALLDDRALARWVKQNTHPHKQPGYISAVISLKPVGGIAGDASADEMDVVANLADKYSLGEVRVSHVQNLVLPHVAKDDLPALFKDLVQAGLATDNIGLVTDIIACPGMDYCALATARSIPLAQRIAERLAPKQHEIGTLHVNISGCINACGHHHVGHIGLLGVDKNGEEVYQITLGGAADEKAAIGKIIGPAVPTAKVPDAIEALMEAYLKLRETGERFIDTYRRLGAEPFKGAIYATH